VDAGVDGFERALEVKWTSATIGRDPRQISLSACVSFFSGTATGTCRRRRGSFWISPMHLSIS